MQSIHPEIQKKLLDARARVRSFVPSSVSNEDARKILARYAAALEGNFIAWMGAGALVAQSVQAKYAASENLWVELKDDHAGMLHRFIASAGVEVTHSHAREVEDVVASIRVFLAKMSSVEILALMAYLENTSAEFIPFLGAIARQLGGVDDVYIRVHGEADVLHADQFAWALGYEIANDDRAFEKIDEAFKLGEQFLRSIFI